MATQTLGRFNLTRLLGEGAQARVWLAFDPRLQREVALKLLLPGTTEEADAWLREGRAVSRLHHPNIVPVFEADRIAGQPALVFEFVGGATLSRWVQGERLSTQQAVSLMVQVLDALACAHAAGVVHRDLKPANVLVDEGLRPRVTDFGIAARSSDPGEALIVGTPGYLSPEAARGEAPQPQMDVFAAAVVLAELLLGRRLPVARDPVQALRDAQQREPELPPLDDADADDTLRAIVQRGLAREREHRWDSAASMRDALTRWMNRAAGEDSIAPHSMAAFEFLLRRMRSQGDFPALSASIERVQKLASSDNESLVALANEILKDVALTQKLLKLVNSAAFRYSGGGSISTVSRAVALVGLGGVRNLALSLLLLERMRDRAHAVQLKGEFLRGLMAGSLARELCDVASEGEEMFLAALFQNLGRLLTEFYFPEEARQVRLLMQRSMHESVRGAAAPPSAAGEAVASVRVLGMSYEDLGIAVARHWGLPEGLTRVMRRPADEPPARAAQSRPEQQRWLARAANDLTDALLATEPAAAAVRQREVGEKYERVLNTSADDWAQACDRARQRLASLAEAMDLRADRHSPARRLLPQAEAAAPADELATIALHATVTETPGVERDRISQRLAAGIQDITDTMVESSDVGSVLRMIVETLYRALEPQRVLLALRDARGEQLLGRFGLGDKAVQLVPLFRVPLRPAPGQAPELLSAVAIKGVDTLIADATQASIAQRLPAWWRQHMRAGSFLLLPLMLKGQPLGLLHVDRERPGAIALSDKELSLLRTLRNQAVMAIRQGGA